MCRNCVKINAMCEWVTEHFDSIVSLKGSRLGPSLLMAAYNQKKTHCENIFSKGNIQPEKQFLMFKHLIYFIV